MEKKPIGRRKFLKIIGGVAVAAGVSGVLWETLRPKEGLNPPRRAGSNQFTQSGKPLVSVIRGSADADIETMVRTAVAAIGGIGKIVTSGKTVVVKPSILTSDPNCAPDPAVVAAVAKLAKEAGGRVTVAESSGGGNTTDCLSRVGITSAAQAVGVDVKALSSQEEITMEVPSGKSLRTVRTYRTIYNCDVLISVPRLKRHGATVITMSLKNMMGVVPQSEMTRFHNVDVSQCIADLNTAIKPDLTVLDVTSAMARTGPTGGQMIRMNTIMASGDPVAIDTVSARMLQELEQKNNIPSFNAAEVRHINAAASLGVGTNNLNEIALVERTVSNEPLISYCGLNCVQCPDHNYLVTCDGCLSTTGRLSRYGTTSCQVRPCAKQREVKNCAYCADYGCSKIKVILDRFPQAKATLDEIRRKL